MERITRAIKAGFEAARKQRQAREMNDIAALESLESRLMGNAKKKAILSDEEYQLLCGSWSFIPTIYSPYLTPRQMCAYCNGENFISVDGQRCNGCGALHTDGYPLAGIFEGVEIFVKRGE